MLHLNSQLVMIELLQPAHSARQNTQENRDSARLRRLVYFGPSSLSCGQRRWIRRLCGGHNSAEATCPKPLNEFCLELACLMLALALQAEWWFHATSDC